MNRRRIQTTLIYIVLITLAALFVFPVLIIFTNSFMSGFEIFNRYTNHVGPGNIHAGVDGINYVRFTLIPDFVSLEQYFRLFFYRPHYLGSFWNSVVLALPVVLGQILISAPAAYAFELSRFRHKEKIYFLYIVIMLLPLQVTLVPNFIMADWLGILDTRAAVILPAMLNPFGVFLMRQYFRGLSSDYVEAAQVDGATHLRIIFSIVVPMFKPALAALIILTFVNNWNIVEQAIIFLSPEQGPLSVYLSRIAEDNLEMIFAASFFYLLPPLLIFLYWKEHMVEGISLSGIR
jgi:multiple sugar transport system permease protein